MRLPIEEIVRFAINRYQMLAIDDSVLAAVSGGADSIALLHLLVGLNYKVHVASFDHQTRDGDSAADVEFVRRLAADLSLSFHTASRPIAEEARAQGRSFEDYAREARYAFLAETARKLGCAAIATGHHAGDQAETVLLRMMRGAGPDALGGIAPVRVARGVRIVRPLIDCTREDIEAYLRQRKVAWREDVSNSDTRHLRNCVRHELLPLLRGQYNPCVDQALNRLAEAQRVDAELLRALAADAAAQCYEGGKGISRSLFSRYPPAVQRRCLIVLAHRHGVELDNAKVLEGVAFVLDASTGKRLHLGGAFSLYSGRTHVRFAPKGKLSNPESTELSIPGETIAFGRRFRARLVPPMPPPELRSWCTSHRKVFDAEKLRAPLLRMRREGDRFVPLGMSGNKKLSDYFIDEGVPEPQRDSIPILAAGDIIYWIVGFGVSAHAAVSSASRQAVEIVCDDIE